MLPELPLSPSEPGSVGALPRQDPRGDVAFVLKWFGTATGVLGALAVAANVGLATAGFCGLCLSSLAWILAGTMMGERSLVVKYAVFTGINVLGLARSLV